VRGAGRSPIDPGTPRDRRSPDGLELSPLPSSGFSSSGALPRERWPSWRVRTGSEGPERPEPSTSESSDQYQRTPAPMVRASDARSASAPVKRARFAFTLTPLSLDVCRVGDRQPGGLPRKIPGFASPPHDGFALDDEPSGRAVCPSPEPSRRRDQMDMTRRSCPGPGLRVSARAHRRPAGPGPGAASDAS
jgi:hypothetical protein